MGGEDGGGSLISPDRVVPSRIVGTSASVIFSCRFLLALAHPCSSGKRAVKRVCLSLVLSISSDAQLTAGNQRSAEW